MLHPTSIQPILLQILVFKHTMYDIYISKFLAPKIFRFSPDELPQCDAVCHMYSKYRCLPTPRPPRVRPDTIPFRITNIIVSLPRPGGESDNISLPRSVIRMCWIMMLNLLLFLLLPPVYFCLFLHKQHNSLEPFPNAHTRSRPTSIGD